MNKSRHAGGCPNGYWLDDIAISEGDAYISGCADGYSAGGHKEAHRPEADTSIIRKDIVWMIREYYRVKPENKFRQIAAVVRQALSDRVAFIKFEIPQSTRPAGLM